jgi:hypothetical protein
MIPVFEVYLKRKFYVVIVWAKEKPRCLLESVICEMNTKKEAIGKKN